MIYIFQDYGKYGWTGLSGTRVTLPRDCHNGWVNGALGEVTWLVRLWPGSRRDIRYLGQDRDLVAPELEGGKGASESEGTATATCTQKDTIDNSCSTDHVASSSTNECRRKRRCFAQEVVQRLRSPGRITRSSDYRYLHNPTAHGTNTLLNYFIRCGGHVVGEISWWLTKVGRDPASINA
ncbi:hypothetical protein BS17DRAFT_767937 [Gyrodon lividus]|nr:hypothetical protein BS17DRAFT_767937 [Gyrodon lividus]